MDRSLLLSLDKLNSRMDTMDKETVDTVTNVTSFCNHLLEQIEEGESGRLVETLKELNGSAQRHTDIIFEEIDKARDIISAIKIEDSLKDEKF